MYNHFITSILQSRINRNCSDWNILWNFISYQNGLQCLKFHTILLVIHGQPIMKKSFKAQPCMKLDLLNSVSRILDVQIKSTCNRGTIWAKSVPYVVHVYMDKSRNRFKAQSCMLRVPSDGVVKETRINLDISNSHAINVQKLE